MSVCADSFGPFASGESLSFTPGMNVLYGPNEAGKSSWHAVLYFGLCGVRRRQGRPDAADSLIAEHHRPWLLGPGADWKVSAVVQLSDGKVIELRHDLASRTAQITDRLLGRDCDLEIIYEGAPDGSRLLGLDRRAFLATACVRQAQLMAVRESAGQLQDYLQRAVATGREDATVVGALQTIDRFRDINVGTDRPNSGKPWRAAIDSVAHSQEELSRARGKHDGHLLLIAQAEDLRGQVMQAQRRLALVSARHIVEDANRLESRAQSAAALHERFEAGPPPASLEDETLVATVAAALTSWENRPAVQTLAGPMAAELHELLNSLPSMPEGDLEPVATIRTASQQFSDADRQLQQHAELEPTFLDEPDSHGATEEDLLALAFAMRRELVSVPPELEERRRQAQQRLEAYAGKKPSKVAIAAGSVALCLGLILGFGFGHALLGIALSAGGAMSLLWFALARDAAPPRNLTSELEAADRELVERRFRSEENTRIREAAFQNASSLGLPVTATELEELARKAAAARVRRAERDGWNRQHEVLTVAVAKAHESLRAALRERGISPGPDLQSQVADYETACRERAVLATKAQGRPSIQAHLDARVEAERRAADDLARLETASTDVVRTAADVGRPVDSPERGAEHLRAWQNERADQARILDKDRADWAELQRLLDGRSIDEIRAEARQRRSSAHQHSADLTPEEIAEVPLETDVDAQIQSLRTAYEDLDRELAQLQGRIDTETETLPSVPALNEAFAAAMLEQERVERLRDTLDLTEAFLREAEERVHRDVAPLLAASVARWLPHVTKGRYTEVTIDPQDLVVRVRLPDGMLHPAHLLSHGTAEQIFLLLRVAMAELLAKPDEPCPLLLDDVTVQSDGERTVAVLDALHALSTERQVILFSQEEEVLHWAENHLGQDRRAQLYQLPIIGMASLS